MGVRSWDIGRIAQSPAPVKLQRRRRRHDRPPAAAPSVRQNSREPPGQRSAGWVSHARRGQSPGNEHPRPAQDPAYRRESDHDGPVRAARLAVDQPAVGRAGGQNQVVDGQRNALAARGARVRLSVRESPSSAVSRAASTCRLPSRCRCSSTSAICGAMR